MYHTRSNYEESCMCRSFPQRCILATISLKRNVNFCFRNNPPANKSNPGGSFNASLRPTRPSKLITWNVSPLKNKGSSPSCGWHIAHLCHPVTFLFTYKYMYRGRTRRPQPPKLGCFSQFRHVFSTLCKLFSSYARDG